LVGKANVDVTWTVLVDLYREQRLLNAERGEQLLRPLVGRAGERRLLHPAEDDAAGLALELQQDHALTRLEAYLVAAVTLDDEEGSAEDRVPREGQLRQGREDPHARVAAILGREQEHSFGEIQLTRDPLHLLVGERLPVREHAELVALERRVGEDVDDVVGVELTGGRGPEHGHGLRAVGGTSSHISFGGRGAAVGRTRRP